MNYIPIVCKYSNPGCVKCVMRPTCTKEPMALGRKAKGTVRLVTNVSDTNATCGVSTFSSDDNTKAAMADTAN